MIMKINERMVAMIIMVIKLWYGDNDNIGDNDWKKVKLWRNDMALMGKGGRRCGRCCKSRANLSSSVTAIGYITRIFSS